VATQFFSIPQANTFPQESSLTPLIITIPLIQLKNHTGGWGHGSSGRAPAWQVQGFEFKLQYCFLKYILTNHIGHNLKMTTCCFTDTSLIQAAIIFRLVFCNTLLIGFSASFLMLLLCKSQVSIVFPYHL
jgi:hypothetical protein